MYKIFGKLAVLVTALSAIGCESELENILLTESFAFLSTVLSAVVTNLISQT
jgi:hypothetical protein